MIAATQSSVLQKMAVLAVYAAITIDGDAPARQPFALARPHLVGPNAGVADALARDPEQRTAPRPPARADDACARRQLDNEGRRVRTDELGAGIVGPYHIDAPTTRGYASYREREASRHREFRRAARSRRLEGLHPSN